MRLVSGQTYISSNVCVYWLSLALALLSSSGGEQHFKPGEVRKAREGKEGDNTLEVVTLVSVYQSSSFCCSFFLLLLV